MAGIIQRYLRRHKNTVNILLHIIGVPLVFIGIAQLFLQYWIYGICSFCFGYVLQFIGHYYFEHNDPGEVLLLKKILRSKNET